MLAKLACSWLPTDEVSQVDYSVLGEDTLAPDQHLQRLAQRSSRHTIRSRECTIHIRTKRSVETLNSEFRSYPYQSQEAQTRRLADFAFMIGDFKLAAATYEIARKDFANDKAWRYFASATVSPQSSSRRGRS